MPDTPDEDYYSPQSQLQREIKSNKNERRGCGILSTLAGFATLGCGIVVKLSSDEVDNLTNSISTESNPTCLQQFSNYTNASIIDMSNIIYDCQHGFPSGLSTFITDACSALINKFCDKLQENSDYLVGAVLCGTLTIMGLGITYLNHKKLKANDELSQQYRRLPR